MALMKVDLPQPFGPMMATCSPAPIFSETSFRASVSPRITVTRSNSMSAGLVCIKMSCIEMSGMQTLYLRGSAHAWEEALMPGHLFLIRHGETEWSLSGQHTSRTDLALTEEGLARAKALGPILQRMIPQSSLALVLSSPMRRALDTAKLAGYRPETEENLREWNYGSYEGLTSGEIQKSAPGWTIWTGAVPRSE